MEDVHLLGGNDGAEWLDVVDIYTPARDDWREAAPMPMERGYGEAVPLDGCIYVMGGGNGAEWLDSMIRLDPWHGWHQVGASIELRRMLLEMPPFDDGH